MPNFKQRISIPLVSTWYAAKTIAIFILISLSFWLMNQPNDFCLYGGILMFVFVIIYVINLIYIYFKNKFK